MERALEFLKIKWKRFCGRSNLHVVPTAILQSRSKVCSRSLYFAVATVGLHSSRCWEIEFCTQHKITIPTCLLLTHGWCEIGTLNLPYNYVIYTEIITMMGHLSSHYIFTFSRIYYIPELILICWTVKSYL